MEKNGSPAVWGVSKEEQMIFATMFFSTGVVNGKKKVVPEPGKHGGYNQSGGQNQK